MSPSGRPAFAFAVLLCVALIAAALTLSREFSKHKELHHATVSEANSNATDLRRNRVDIQSRRDTPRDARTTTPARDKTAGVHEIGVRPAPVLPSLTGYVVDMFDDWTTIPAGYRADGIVLRDGAITLAGDADSTAPRIGSLISPPLPLRAPALAAPSDDSRPLPIEAGARVEISLTEDGAEWSPWVVLEKYHKPDGKLVSAPLQPSLAKADLRSADQSASTTIAGPAIRYRLHLSASGVVSPKVSDVRIWKREYH